jgi:phosphatidylglycerophosphate synthase
MVNKIPLEYENPIDVILYNQVDRDLEFYKKLGLTPNGLTTISLILALVGIYNFHYDNYFISALLFFISYYFDCADGKMARKYQMYSKFGDYYDHFSDLAKLILLFYVFYKKSFDKFIKIFVITLILFTLTFFQIICSEKIYNNKSESSYLNLFKFELDNCEEKIHYFKYFSGATPITFLTLSMLLWNKI